eukprot:2573281-Rhodomonas_salina.3
MDPHINAGPPAWILVAINPRHNPRFIGAKWEDTLDWRTQAATWNMFRATALSRTRAKTLAADSCAASKMALLYNATLSCMAFLARDIFHLCQQLRFRIAMQRTKCTVGCLRVLEDECSLNPSATLHGTIHDGRHYGLEDEILHHHNSIHQLHRNRSANPHPTKKAPEGNNVKTDPLYAAGGSLIAPFKSYPSSLANEESHVRIQTGHFLLMHASSYRCSCLKASGYVTSGLFGATVTLLLVVHFHVFPANPRGTGRASASASPQRSSGLVDETGKI